MRTLILIFISILILFTFSCSEDSTSSDNQSPTVMIIYPPENAEFESGSIINITAEAEDNKKIDYVEFFIDGSSVYEDSSEPYDFTWNTTGIEGSHTIYAKTEDSSENSSTSELIFVLITPYEGYPETPSNPDPAQNEISISVYTELSWTCTDPDGDPLTYDVYFGTNPIPPLVSTGQSENTYNPGALIYETTYYWKITASDGTFETEGDVWEFTTRQQYGTVTDIDGNVYQTMEIGGREWMVENLKVTHYRNGDPIPNLTADNDWENTANGAYCVYNNITSYADTYGNLYNWYAVDDARGIAPEGWHVPTDEEIIELEMYLGMTYSEAYDIDWRGINEGSKLAGRADLWFDGELEYNSEFGSSGFDCLPGGYRYINYQGVGFDYLGSNGYLWASTEYDNYSGWSRYLSYVTPMVFRNAWDKRYGFSVRCIKD